VRLRLITHATDGKVFSTERIELPELPVPGTVLRPPICRTDCFVTRAAPASVEDTGDIGIAGTVYADVTGALG
jgi:hypothetical protein